MGFKKNHKYLGSVYHFKLNEIIIMIHLWGPESNAVSMCDHG